MTQRKILALFLILTIVLTLAACTKPNDPAPPKDPLSEPVTLSIDAENLPVIDGALACLPFYEETVSLITGLPIEEARTYVLANNTPASFRELAEGTADLGFLLHASDEQAAYAKEYGVTYEYEPYAKDAFVFFVNKDNPVDSLTMDQLKNIYAGKITNWKEVGGSDEPIIAYQRNEGSGSQTGLYQYVISPDEVMDPPTEIRIGDMGGIIDAVAHFENARGALGYSYLYFVTNQHYDEDIKLLKVNGFAPDEANIRSDKYPMVTEYCLVTRSGEATEGSFLRQIIDWCLSDQGQALAKKLSYIPVKENAGPFVAPALPAMIRTPLHETRCVVTGNHLEESTVDYKNGDGAEGAYVQIAGLKDKAVENKINRAIAHAFIEMIETDELPAYRGIAVRTADFDGIIPDRSANAWSYANFGNIISVMVSTSRYYNDPNGGWMSWSAQRGMTFDLSTGEQLKITDLFDDPEAGLAYLNGRVQDYIENEDSEESQDWGYYGPYGTSTFRLAGTFPGLTEDQNFILTDIGTIQLIFDEKTPWVSLSEFYPASIGVDVTDGISLDKFRTERSLFIDETPSMRLIAHPFPESETVSVWDWSDSLFGKEGSSFGYDLTYYESMPEGQIASLPVSEEERDSFLAEVSEAYERIEAENPDLDIRMTASLSGYVTRVADYTSVYSGQSYYASAYRNGTWVNQLESRSAGQYTVFKGDSTEPLTIEDLFRKGADIPALLKKAAWKELEASGYDYVKEARMNGWFDDLLDDLYGRSLLFAIGSEELSVYPEGMEYVSLYDLVRQYGGDNLTREIWVYTEALQVLRYDLIGIENLTIFD